MDTKSAKNAAVSDTAVKADQVDDTVNKTDDPKAAPVKEKFVEYTGNATRRVLSSQDWERVGLKGEENVWGFHNSFRIPVSDFSQEQVKYLVETDGKFKVV